MVAGAAGGAATARTATAAASLATTACRPDREADDEQHDQERKDITETDVAHLGGACGQSDQRERCEQACRGYAADALFGQHPVRRRVHPCEARPRCKSYCRRRPDVGGWFVAKPLGVAGLGLGVLVFEAIIFCGTAPRGPVMQRAPEDVPAEFPPIGPCVHEVQMPGLIDFIRGRHGVPRTKSQKQEASIFIHHTSCELG